MFFGLRGELGLAVARSNGINSGCLSTSRALRVESQPHELTMPAKLFTLFALLIGTVAVANAGFHPCQCCSDDPPERCSQIRMMIPCDNPQFQGMCSLMNAFGSPQVRNV